MGGGGDDVDVIGVKEVKNLFVGGGGDGEVEDHASGGADDVGVKDIDEGFADDEGIGAGGFGGADHVAEVTGFFDGFDDEEEGVRGEGEVGEVLGPGFRDGEEAVWAFAEGDFFEDVFCDFLEEGAGFLSTSEEGLEIGVLEVGGAVEEFDDFDVGFEGFGEFFVAFDEELADGVAEEFFLAEFDEGFNFFVLFAADDIGRFYVHAGEILMYFMLFYFRTLSILYFE